MKLSLTEVHVRWGEILRQMDGGRKLKQIAYDFNMHLSMVSLINIEARAKGYAVGAGWGS